MSILKQLENIIKESYKVSEKVIKEEFEMEPDSEQESYLVKFDNEEICNVDIISNITDKSEDLETAQENPEDFTVYISDVKNKEKTEEYKNKLLGLGFENISVEDAEIKEPEMASIVDESKKAHWFYKIVDEVGKFWVVTKPTKESVLEDICFDSDILGMSRRIKCGLDVSEIVGFYTVEQKAQEVAEELLAKVKE